MRRALLFLIFLAIGPAVAHAGRPSLEVSLNPQKLGVDDLTVLTIRIVDAGRATPQTSLGKLENFQIAQGPSRESQFSWVNGQATSAIKLSWVLKPRTTGKASVGPIRVKVGKEDLSAGAVLAEIVPGSIAVQRPRRVSPFGVSDPFGDLFGRSRRRQPQRSRKIILRRLLTKTRAFTGETLTASIYLDTNGGGVDGFEWVDQPEYPGFWVQQIQQPDQVRPETIKIEGEPFNRFLIAQSVLVPLKAASITLPPVSAKIGFRSMSFFNPSSVVQRSTGPTTLEIQAPPAAPSDFTGAIGKLKYSVSLKPDKLRKGESTTVQIKVSGKGNLPLIQAPLHWPECTDCKLYPPEEENAFKVDRNGIRGSKTWKATLLPREAGEIEMPGFSLSHFDPEKKAYISEKFGPWKLVVEAPTPTPSPEAPQAENPSSLPNGKTDGSRNDSPRLPTWALLLLTLVIGLSLGGGLAWWFTRSASGKLPARHRDQTPADRARQLQGALERWWLDLPSSNQSESIQAEMQNLRKQLEAIRFAPGRADHSETIIELEKKLRRLMR